MTAITPATLTEYYQHHFQHREIQSLEAIIYKVIKTYYGDEGMDPQEEELLKEQLPRYLNAYLHEMSGVEFVHAEIIKLSLSERTKLLLCNLAELIHEVTETARSKPALIIKTPEEVYKQFYHLKFLTHEIVKVLYLNNRNELIKSRDVAIGDQNTAAMKPWNIFGMAFQLASNRIIIVHNHPTGKCVPSEDDLRFTRRVMECAKILSVQFIDHIIIGESYYSFRYNDLL